MTYQRRLSVFTWVNCTNTLSSSNPLNLPQVKKKNQKLSPVFYTSVIISDICIVCMNWSVKALLLDQRKAAMMWNKCTSLIPGELFLLLRRKELFFFLDNYFISALCSGCKLDSGFPESPAVRGCRWSPEKVEREDQEKKKREGKKIYIYQVMHLHRDILCDSKKIEE